MASKLEALKEEAEIIWNLKDALRLMGWDQQIIMPTKSAPARSRQMASLSRVAHERLIGDDLLDLLEAAEGEVDGREAHDDDLCYVRAVRRERDRSAKLAPELVEELTRTCAVSFDAWVKAKAEDDWDSFKPYLKKVLDLKLKVAEHRGYEEHPYDAFLDDFERGMKASEVKALFDGFRPGLVDLVERIKNSDAVPANGPLDQDFPIKKQSEVSAILARSIGYKVEMGRIDVGPHPFCSASAAKDVRITNRFHLDHLQTALFGTLHEAGHAIYEQNSPERFDHSPLRGGCSLGVHESQSRMWENFVGRSRPFWKCHFPLMKRFFPEQLMGYSEEDFYKAINRVEASFIRVEADEVTYTLHVIARFEIEMAMVSGEVGVDDIPELWNQKMKDYLGIVPPSDRLGCLQDIHWSDGLIGYFPTYSLGNMIAAQMWDRINEAIPDLNQQLEGGDVEPLTNWLRANVYDHASKFEPQDLVQRATGKKLDYLAFQNYLLKKYEDIYQL